jgi:hypothetical protein
VTEAHLALEEYSTLPLMPSHCTKLWYAVELATHGTLTVTQSVSAPWLTDGTGKAVGVQGKAVSPPTEHPLLQ